MRKLSAILSLFLLGNLTSFAQPVTRQFQVADRDIREGYITEKVWLKNYARPKVSMVQADFKHASGLPDGAEIKPATDFDVVIGMERKKPFAFVRIPAYSADAQTKQLQQLTSFTLHIEETQAAGTAAPHAKTTASGSVLTSGTWYKIAVSAKGIYKIDHDFIKNKLGVDPSSFDSRNIRVYGNGGVMMPESNAVPVPDDLVENAVVVSDGGDNKLDQGDYVLFYANGPMGWKKDTAKKTFNHIKNIYEDKSYYFINFDQGPGKRIGAQESAATGNVTVVAYDNYQVHEEDLVNLGKFGKKWWGEDFGTDPGKQSSRTFNFNIGASDSVTLRVVAGSRSTASVNTFTIKLNGVTLGSHNAPSIFTPEDYAVRAISANYSVPVTGATANVQITYAPGEYSGRGYLDYIEAISRSPLSMADGFISFRDWRSVGAGNARFQVQNCNGNTVVWDITDPLQPVRINGSLSGTTYSFIRDASDLREYVVFDGSKLLAPEFIKKTDNQNLHGASQVDFVIVTHPDFTGAADKLADFHRQQDNMRVIVATTEQVYNEFGSGSQDIAAIRDFVKMFYKRAGNDTTEMPRYLLLLGDASYDYKNRTANNTNFVPTYETLESEDVIGGYCSDDFFSFLDDTEDIESMQVANVMDLGVGRIPVNSAEAANRAVDKILKYKSPASLGPWRLSTTIMADDGDGNVHFQDGELMGATINAHSNLYNETKVYVSALPLVPTPGGLRCPDANAAINNQVDHQGTFLMNYNGHGSTTTLAHERILTQDDFNTWKNENRLPIMVTATCTFSKYDDPSYVSAGEQLIVKPNGGAIALLTTTQLVFQGLNQTMNVDFLDAFFQQYNGNWPAFGDAFRYGKNATYAHTNSGVDNFRKFVLLGDPALTAVFPKHKVHTEAILDGNTLQPLDTMRALGMYVIKGSVKSTDGQLLDDFNGRVHFTIYDKVKVANTLTGPYRTFNVQNNVIFKGKATVTNGLFSFTFITPKDLNYDFGKGKISYYAENGTIDAAGADTALTIGGFSDVVIEDDQPPVVRPFMNDSMFKDGGITGSNTILYAQLSDETGINVSGNGVGHDLTAVLDDNIGHPYVLNDYYETAPNDYKRGYVYFPVTGLSEGRHRLRIKAWDMLNNSGEGVVNFEVVNGGVVKVQNLMNYPNPFSDKTHFVFEHNHPGEELKVQIYIYSTSGYLVRTITEHFTPDGSRSNEITWDATDNNGAKLPAGVYVYRLNLATEKGIQATAYQKLVLIR